MKFRNPLASRRRRVRVRGVLRTRRTPQGTPPARSTWPTPRANPRSTPARRSAYLAKKAVYKGEGSTIETKANSNASIVLSNGIGIYFDVSTRTEIRGFMQAPFRPNRTDMDDEPSISRTDMYIDYGVVGVSTSKMAAGSTLLFETPLATADIHGRQAVFQVGDNVTTISMLAGRRHRPGRAPWTAPARSMAASRSSSAPARPGQANIVEIQAIPDGRLEGQREWLVRARPRGRLGPEARLFRDAGGQWVRRQAYAL